MRSQLRTGLPGLGQNQREHRHLAGLVMNRQPEPLRQQSPHHQPHLALAGITLRPRLDIEPFRRNPAWQLRQQVLHIASHHLVRK